MPAFPAEPDRAAAGPTPEPASAAPAGPCGVLAVLVAHDGAGWLPEALAALQAQTVRPDRVVAVDTGSTDGSGDLLRAALGDDAVVVLPRRTGYPDAVAAGIRHAAADPAVPLPWLWLLHDDAAPDPDCLERLLDEGGRQPSAGLLGPKAVDWDDPRVLVEVGVTTDRSGTRSTGLERRELDQGQHDAVRDVLAAGTAGLLARREVWDAVGGLEPTLPLFRDELDLGWRVTSSGSRVVVVPTARVRHARAATTGRRSRGVVRRRPTQVDRRHAMLVLLAHTSRRRFALALPALVLGSLVRAVGLLLLRRPGAARDEVGALGGVLRGPRRLLRLRRARARLRTVPPSAVRPLLATRTGRLRARLDSVGGWIAAGAPAAAPRAPGLGEAGDDEHAGLPAGSGAWRSVLARPPVLVLLGLGLVALVAERSVLPVSGGLLSGGRLLPPPPGAADLWQAWTSSWSTAGTGADAVPAPRVAVLAALSGVLLGKPWLAVDVLLLASVPLAGLTAWVAARRVVASGVLRLWAAAAWALLPVATGAVAAGRLDAAAVQVLLPLVGLALAGAVVHDPRGRWHRVWGAGLLLAVACALAPTLWLVAAPLLVVGAAALVLHAPRAQRPVARRRALAAVVAAAVPVVLLLPWSLEVWRAPGLLLHGPGRLALDPALATSELPAWHLPLLSPGGAGLPPAWVTGGLLAAALTGLVRAGGRRTGLAGWAVALGGLAAAAALSRTAAQPPAGGPELPVWPGVPLQVAAAGLLLAALVAGDGARERLRRLDFGWRQPVATLVAGLAAAVPVLCAGAWVVRGADDPLARRVVQVVPAFVTAELQAEPGLRALALEPGRDGTVGYELLTGSGVRLGTSDLAPGASADGLDEVVADLLTARGSDAAEALSTRAVRYVALPRSDAGSDVAAALDTQPGLTRRSEEPVLLWQVTAPAHPLVVLPPALAERAGADGAAPTGRDLADAPPEPLRDGATVPAGRSGRLLVLAQARDDGWRASVDGEELRPATAWGWAQAFALPEDGGRLDVSRDDAERRGAVVVQAALVALVAVLAVPGARRRSGLEPVDDEPGVRR